jgi:cytochrome c oxidase assembly protein subunit 15
MVKSGLVNVPAVSHYRLAAHLSLAFFVAAYVLWIALDLASARERPAPGAPNRVAKGAIWGFMGLLAVQIVWGAFMAGSRAGYLFSTFPDMNGALVPPSWLNLEPVWHNFVQNPVAIHFLHRMLAYLVTLAAVILAVVGLRRARTGRQKVAALALGAGVLAQFTLGVLTVLWNVQIAVATAHQGLALVLLSFALWFAHAFTPGRSSRR